MSDNLTKFTKAAPKPIVEQIDDQKKATARQAIDNEQFRDRLEEPTKTVNGTPGTTVGAVTTAVVMGSRDAAVSVGVGLELEVSASALLSAENLTGAAARLVDLTVELINRDTLNVLDKFVGNVVQDTTGIYKQTVKLNGVDRPGANKVARYGLRFTQETAADITVTLNEDYWTIRKRPARSPK